MSIGILYNRKCDNCGKPHPKFLMMVHEERADGALTPMVWCIECVRKEN